jgi:hypothetical protein
MRSFLRRRRMRRDRSWPTNSTTRAPTASNAARTTSTVRDSPLRSWLSALSSNVVGGVIATALAALVAFAFGFRIPSTSEDASSFRPVGYSIGSFGYSLNGGELLVQAPKFQPYRALGAHSIGVSDAQSKSGFAR